MINSMDVDKLKASAKFTFGRPIQLIGQYTAKGKVQVLPINGKGPCNITLGKYHSCQYSFTIFTQAGIYLGRYLYVCRSKKI